MTGRSLVPALTRSLLSLRANARSGVMGSYITHYS